MIKKLKHLFLICFLAQTSSLVCKINLDEFNSYVTNLAEHYNLQSANEGQTSSIESIEFTMRLLEKSSNDLVAEKIAQKIYNSLHKYLPTLTHAIAFEPNFTQITDFAEELFRCTITPTDEALPQITPFRYSLTYAILAISKIALSKELNETQELSSKQITSLKTKLRQNFKNAFYKEKTNLQNSTHINMKNINELCDAIELLIPTQEKTNSYFNKAAIFIGLACGITISTCLIKMLLNSIEKERNLTALIGDPKNDEENPLGKDNRHCTLRRLLIRAENLMGIYGSEDPRILPQACQNFSEFNQQIKTFLPRLIRILEVMTAQTAAAGRPESFWSLQGAPRKTFDPLHSDSPSLGEGRPRSNSVGAAASARPPLPGIPPEFQ